MTTENVETSIPELIKMKGSDIIHGDLIALENDLWQVDHITHGAVPDQVYARVRNLDGYQWWPYIPLDEDVMVIRLTKDE